MMRTISIACLLLLGVCAHAQEAVDPRGRRLSPMDFDQASLAPVATVWAKSAKRPVRSSVLLELTFDEQGRVTDAQLETPSGDGNVDRAMVKWAKQLRLKPPVQAGRGYLPLEFSGSARQLAEECYVVAQNASGALERRALKSLRVRQAEAETFTLPADAPANVKMIQCARPSLLPEDADLKVVDAGFPFSIASGTRVGLLTTEGGQLHYKLLAGALTEGETSIIDAFIKRARERAR